MFRPYIIASAMAIVFCISAHFFLTTYREYALNQEKLRYSTIQPQALREYERKQEKQKRIYEQVSKFIDHAGSLGLEKDEWAYYRVNIEESVSFAEAERILRQTANSESYYFKPIMLHMKTRMESGDAITPSTPGPVAADSFDTEKGDLLLTLKGAFMVKPK